MPLAPRPWTTKSMSATPGAFVPVLYAILQEYGHEHVAAENSLKPTPTLPKLFALTPVPKFKQRFISVNDEALRTLLDDTSEPNSYEGHCRLFQKVFNTDQYRFFRYDLDRIRYTGLFFTNDSILVIMIPCLQTTSTRTAWLYIFSSQEPPGSPPFSLKSVISLAKKWMSVFMSAPLIPVVSIFSQQP